MEKINVTCKIRFDSAHRLYNYEGKCAFVHGHGYEGHVSAAGKALDSQGMVIDFVEFKKRLNRWIDDHWDHSVIVYKEDKEAIEAFQKLQGDERLFIADFNPTVENMARYLLLEVCPLLFKDTSVKAIKVVLYETPNCYTEVSVEE